jgi:hypothetical protein
MLEFLKDLTLGALVLLIGSAIFGGLLIFFMRHPVTFFIFGFAVLAAFTGWTLRAVK